MLGTALLPLLKTNYWNRIRSLEEDVAMVGFLVALLNCTTRSKEREQILVSEGGVGWVGELTARVYEEGNEKQKREGVSLMCMMMDELLEL